MMQRTRRALDAQALLDNEALARISHSQPNVEDAILLDALIDKRRRLHLSPDEEQLLAEVIDWHDRVLADLEHLWQQAADNDRRGLAERAFAAVIWIWTTRRGVCSVC